MPCRACRPQKDTKFNLQIERDFKNDWLEDKFSISTVSNDCSCETYSRLPHICRLICPSDMAYTSVIPMVYGLW